MKKYKLSRWFKLCGRSDVTAIFHSLSLALAYIPTIQFEAFEKEISNNGGCSKEKIESLLDEDFFLFLKDEGLIVLSEEHDIRLLESTRNDLLERVSLNVMYILLTDRCNMACTYCFEESPEGAQSAHATTMSLETAEDAVKAFSRLSAKHGDPEKQKIIQLYGGEPLLNKRGVRKVVETVNQLSQKNHFPEGCRVTLITNGTIFTEEDAIFFAENNVHVAVSIDAPRELNNLYRIAKDGKTNVFDESIKAYCLAKKHGVHVGLSATLTPEVVENFDEVLEFFVENVSSDGGMGFNMMHYSPFVPVGTEYFEKAAECIRKAYIRFRELDIFEDRFMRKVEAFVMRRPIFVDCGVTGGQIVVAPDGAIGVCQDFVKPRKYFTGSVKDPDFDPVEDGLFANWRFRSPFFMEECIDCEAVAICGGGCPASVEMQNGSRWEVDQRVCPHSKGSLQWLIWDTYENL